MNTDKMMIGDIVNIKCLNIEDEEVFLPGKIVSIGEDFVSATAIDDTYQFGCPEIFEGVQLTAEILEKNGFFNDPKEITLRDRMAISGKDYHFVGEKVHVKYDVMFHVMEAYHGANRFLTLDILYVHELQHALRLCGLGEIADNIKI